MRISRNAGIPGPGGLSTLCTRTAVLSEVEAFRLRPQRGGSTECRDPVRNEVISDPEDSDRICVSGNRPGRPIASTVPAPVNDYSTSNKWRPCLGPQ